MYRAYLDQSQIFVGIYWQRYGWVGPGMQISGLEDEFRLAAGMPMLLYLKHPAPDREPGLTAMIDGIRSAGAVSYRRFSTARELERLLADDLAVVLSESFADATISDAPPTVSPTGQGMPDGGELPAGTVTFLLTDIEGSTRLWEAEPEAMELALQQHDRVLSEVIERHGGAVIVARGEGDSADYAEVRVGSGALANLYAFMACCEPGDAIVAPPASIAGHVTHHAAGAAGLYRLQTVAAPVDPVSYTVDVEGLAELAKTVRPKVITIGGSLNLTPHPVPAIREIADSVEAKVLFDAAHLCGLIAGGAWPNPLDQGAHLMSMSTYKSLGGPPGGLLLANDAELAQRLEAIAYPGLTANFDAGKTAALAQTMLDWTVAGPAYAAAMVDTARALADQLIISGLPVFRRTEGVTGSHQFALEAASLGGGQAASTRLRRANLLASGIGLPIAPVESDLNGVRLGTPEVARLGMTPADMPQLASFITRALAGAADDDVASDVAAWRTRFDRVWFTTDDPTVPQRATAV